MDPYLCLTAVGKVFSFHQREQKWEMCYKLASPSTALSHFNCAWCISKRKQTNKWHWAVLEVIVGTIWTNYISWWATQCNTKNRVTGNKKQTPKTTPTPQLDGRAAILFQTHLPPFIFTPSPPPGRLPARPGPACPPAGEAPHRPHGSCRRPAAPERPAAPCCDMAAAAQVPAGRPARGSAGGGGGEAAAAGRGKEVRRFPLVAAAARLRGEEPRGRGIRTAGPRGGQSVGRPGPAPSERPGTGGDRGLARLPGVPSPHPPSRDFVPE